jgi:hypothetical protein
MKNKLTRTKLNEMISSRAIIIARQGFETIRLKSGQSDDVMLEGGEGFTSIDNSIQKLVKSPEPVLDLEMNKISPDSD